MLSNTKKKKPWSILQLCNLAAMKPTYMLDIVYYVIKKQGVTITKWMCVCMFIEEGIVH
jgi:hypothetical protein